MLIRLSGCQRYSYKGELFQKGFEYDIADSEKAALLLSKVDMYGRQYFEKTVPSPALEVISESTITASGEKIKRTRSKPVVNPDIKKGGEQLSLMSDEDLPESFTKKSGSSAVEL
jgi:hypothetical protein